MSNRRLLVYAVLDLVVWGLVGYLLFADTATGRLRFWYSATHACRAVAETAGWAGLRCERRYFEVVRSLA